MASPAKTVQRAAQVVRHHAVERLEFADGVQQFLRAFLHAPLDAVAGALQVQLGIRAPRGLALFGGAGLHQRSVGLLQRVALGEGLADQLVGADRGGEAGEQARARQFVLGAVVVDVVRAHRLQLGRVPRLAGAQDDAQGHAAQVLADAPDQPQAGVGRLHHHVEQHHRDVVAAGEHAQRVLARTRMQQRDGAVGDRDVLQREAGGGVDIFVVVDHEHVPGIAGQRRRGARRGLGAPQRVEFGGGLHRRHRGTSREKGGR